jgi:hypothetical protein
LILLPADRQHLPCCHWIPVMRIHLPILNHGFMDPAPPVS